MAAVRQKQSTKQNSDGSVSSSLSLHLNLRSDATKLRLVLIQTEISILSVRRHLSSFNIHIRISELNRLQPTKKHKFFRGL